MALVYENPSIGNPLDIEPNQFKKNAFTKPDTRVPPKAKPIIGDILVNGEKITEREILAEAQNHPSDTPGAALQESARALVVRELLWQEAEKNDIAVEPSTDSKGRSESRKDAAIDALIDSVISVPNATEEECLNYYEKHKSRFMSDSLYEARHILLAAPESDSKARENAKRQAESICAKLMGDRSEFSNFAETYSACPSKKQGGNLGQLTRGSTVPEFESALEKMNEGQISEKPVETKYGFHVVFLERKVPGKALPFELVRDQIGVWLEASSWSKSVSQYIEILAKSAEIQGMEIL